MGLGLIACEGSGDVEGVVTLLVGVVAQAFHDDRVVELRVQLGVITCGRVEDVISVLTPVRRGVAQVFHVILVELQVQLVVEVEEEGKEDGQEESEEVERRRRSSQRETTTHVYGMEMDVKGARLNLSQGM